MKLVTAVITFSMTLGASSLAVAQPGGTPPQDVPAFPVPALRDFVPVLAKAVELIGQNRVEDSFNTLKTELNPAFRSQGAHEKFRDSWMKLFLQVGRLRLEFESYDIVGYYRNNAVRTVENAAILNLNVGSATAIEVADPVRNIDDSQPLEDVRKFTLVADDLEHAGQIPQHFRIAGGVTPHHDGAGPGVLPCELPNQLTPL